jgi:hypothetical protein
MINKIPIEFRELIHPDKRQSQGILEMFTEIFPADEAKMHPIAKIKAPSKEEYEVRLIIWETRDVPPFDGDSINIQVRVIFDPEGWAGEKIERETDIHYNCK